MQQIYRCAANYVLSAASTLVITTAFLTLAHTAPASVQPLAWDPGIADAGTRGFTNHNVSGGDFYFKIIPQNTAVGVWRTALKVTSGEADLYWKRGEFADDPGAYDHASTRTGSDGFVLDNTRFTPGEDWHLLVRSQPGAQWTLVSGEAYVRDLGALGEDSNGGEPMAIGPEGMRFYRTSIPAGTMAWRLWLKGAQHEILVRKAAAPALWDEFSGAYDLRQRGQMLVVPEYLDTDTSVYFIGVPGAPGTVIQLDSRKQPVAELGFAVTNAPVTISGYGYTTYRVQVPVEQIAWQIDVVPETGDPNLAVRREHVPNEWHNDALSAVGGSIIDSLTLVPPTLSDGTFYLTVFGDGPYTFRLRNGHPVITPMHYIGEAVNQDLNRVGWRFFAVTDTEEQLGSLGWNLDLLNAPPNSRIALRRNAVPSMWNYRTYENGGYGIGGHYDILGGSFLQHPGHPADIWYVGVYNDETPLDNFTLRARHLTASALAYAGGRVAHEQLTAPRIDYYAVSIPANTASWRIKLTPTVGEVHLLGLKDGLPAGDAMNSLYSPPGKSVQKPGAEHLVVIPNQSESYLQVGTYYLGVMADGTGTSGYVLESLGPLPIANLGAFGAGGLTHADALEGGTVKAYQFTVPAGLLSLEVRLENRVGNPVMSLTRGTQLPGGYGAEYGLDGGAGSRWSHPELITVPNPEAGVYSLMIIARADQQGDYSDCAFTLRMRPLNLGTVAFDGGRTHVSQPASGTWRYFQIEAPAQALGWDLRLTNIVGGFPRLYVRRDLAPDLGNAPSWSGRYEGWPSGRQWEADADWTGYGLDPDGVSRWGRMLAMGMGSPLEPGTYYVGIFNPADTETSYTLVSRGLGEGFTIPVRTIAFAGGAITNNQLAAGEAAYYRIEVPEETPSWKVTLKGVSGETLLLARKDAPPNVDADSASAVAEGGAGKKLQRSGREHFLLLPAFGRTNLAAGSYYLAVVSEGSNPGESTIGEGFASYVLQSQGVMPVSELGTVSSTDLTRTDTVQGGEIKAYQFNVSPNISSVEIRLENRTGNPAMMVRSGAQFPAGGNSTTIFGDYGCDGGEGHDWVDGELITLANPVPGVYSLLIKGLRDQDGTWPDAAYTLRLHPLTEALVDFDGGEVLVSNQEPGTWRYFGFSVPADAHGWDVRLLDVQGSNPRLVIRRDVLPEGFADNLYGHGEEWRSGWQWWAGPDWVGYGEWPDGSSRNSHTLAMGMGQPLEPGIYYAGVYNWETNSSYRLVSRGIGAGYSLPVETLDFAGGVIVHPGLAAGEAAFYRVTIPSNTPSWKLTLTPESGEAFFILQRQWIPNVLADEDNTVTEPSGGRRTHKAGKEHFLLFPEAGETSLRAGIYYIAVVSEGVNPTETRIGQGMCRFTLSSQGPAPARDLGVLSAEGIVLAETLEGGETRAYTFTVPPDTQGIEARLEDRIGQPAMTLRPGNEVPTGSSYYPLTYYGTAGGLYSPFVGAGIITVPNAPAGPCQLVIKASVDSSGQYPDARFTLRLQRQAIPVLNFAARQNTNGFSHTASGVLADQQSAFYQVVVPEKLDGAPILGWQLTASQQQGRALLRVCKGQLPANDAAETSPFVTDVAVYVPEFLTPGTWFVEVRANGTTEYTLTSQPVALERPAWSMPAAGQSGATPGLTSPEFADSGVAADGLPLPGDQGVDLAQGNYHFYAMDVPPGNAGLLRVELRALSGNPDVYARIGAVPSLSHGALGMWDRAMTGTESDYANWVPYNSRYESALAGGRWYLAVHAAGNSNVRYRIKCSTGNVQPLAWNGGTFANQTLAAGDWRYYQVKLPTNAPAEWRVAFAQTVGEVAMYVRDTVPPGTGGYFSSAVDWGVDNKNSGPYRAFTTPGEQVLTTPPLRPGHAYYLGFQARQDATFSVSSTISGGFINVNETVAFYGGFISNNLASHGIVRYRIDVPAEATRLIGRATHLEDVKWYLEQGTLPVMGDSQFASYGLNCSLVQILYSQGWPWIPGYSYYLVATNTSTANRPFTFFMDGRNATTEDDDQDGLPDAWERQYFEGHWAGWPDGDPDRDGLSNLAEFLGGTNPLVLNPANVRLTIPTRLPNGRCQLIVRGAENRSYRIEASTDLRNWTTLTNIASGVAEQVFTDEFLNYPPGRFYRVVSP